MKIKQFIMFAAVLALLSVLLGAFASHGLKQHLSAKSLGWMMTASSYQMTHALAILAVSILMIKVARNSLLLISCYSFCVGIILFSGSLYVLAFSEMGLIPSSLADYVVFITPLGGLVLIFGWFSLLLAAKNLDAWQV